MLKTISEEIAIQQPSNTPLKTNGTASPLHWSDPAYAEGIDYDFFVIEDDEPVDGVITERQMHLLTDSLRASWDGPGEGRSFLAMANVGLFYDKEKQAIVPDVMVSLDVHLPEEIRQKPDQSYFIWRYGKLPEVVVEIVSNRVGKEGTKKLALYAQIGITHYIIFDPEGHLSRNPLRIFALENGKYRQTREPWLDKAHLGVMLWDEPYDGLHCTWLRWYNAKGEMLLTGAEKARKAFALVEEERYKAEQAHVKAAQERIRAEQERIRAEKERKRADQAHLVAEQERAKAEQERAKAEQERTRAERLAAQLMALGIEPEL